MKRTIVLFGSTGMLGDYCLHQLRKNHIVITVNRNQYNILENNYEKLYSILEKYNNAIIINCAGTIPQNHMPSLDFFMINSLFPKMLEHASIKLHFKMIHISTNCVFNHTMKNTNENEMPNETSIYGLSKHLGEPEKVSVIRTSIIGEEKVNKKSFLEWVIANKGGTINGYTNCFWNGVSCLTLAIYIDDVINTNDFWKGVKHIYSKEILSKHEIACIINDVYQLNIVIKAIELKEAVYKTLSSNHDKNMIKKTIRQQIIEQKQYNDLKLGPYKLLTKCRCCNNSNLKEIWKLEKTPLAGGFLEKTEDVIYEKYYPLTLLYCNNCYSSFVKEIIQEEKLFTNINNNGYFYFSSQILSLVEHFKLLYNYIKSKYDLKNKQVLEIGCNDGVFLNNFDNSDGLKSIIGIDPSVTILKINKPNIIKINNFFNVETSNQILTEYGKMDVIVACNCLAHIDDINNIFENIRYLLNDNGVFIMEVHYIKFIYESMNFDFIYHEHMSYYSMNGIYNICKSNNLYLENVEIIENHGGSLRVTIKKTIDNNHHNPSLSTVLKQENIHKHMKTLSPRINEWTGKIQEIINGVHKTEGVIAGYGASGRTNIILTTIQKKFDYIFDDSSAKINNFIPMFHTQITDGNEIYDKEIKTIFILAWPYSKYIINKHKKFIENGGRFIIILPKIKEINKQNLENYLNKL